MEEQISLTEVLKTVQAYWFSEMSGLHLKKRKTTYVDGLVLWNFNSSRENRVSQDVSVGFLHYIAMAIPNLGSSCQELENKSHFDYK